MNPGTLFDYLDGKLSASERTELEAQLVADPGLRRELAVAREIHSGIRQSTEALEALSPASEAARGAILGRRVAIVFALLVFLNVLFGIYAIWFMKKRPAFVPDQQSQQRLSRALQNAATTVLPTPTLEIEEIKIPAPKSQRDAVANKIIAAATECGGSAAKNLNDENGLLLFAEIPAPQESNFREKLVALGAAPSRPDSSLPGEKRIIQIRIVQSPDR